MLQWAPLVWSIATRGKKCSVQMNQTKRSPIENHSILTGRFLWTKNCLLETLDRAPHKTPINWIKRLNGIAEISYNSIELEIQQNGKATKREMPIFQHISSTFFQEKRKVFWSISFLVLFSSSSSYYWTFPGNFKGGLIEFLGRLIVTNFHL